MVQAVKLRQEVKDVVETFEPYIQAAVHLSDMPLEEYESWKTHYGTLVPPCRTAIRKEIERRQAKVDSEQEAERAQRMYEAGTLPPPKTKCVLFSELRPSEARRVGNSTKNLWGAEEFQAMSALIYGLPGDVRHAVRHTKLWVRLTKPQKELANYCLSGKKPYEICHLLGCSDRALRYRMACLYKHLEPIVNAAIQARRDEECKTNDESFPHDAECHRIEGTRLANGCIYRRPMPTSDVPNEE